MNSSLPAVKNNKPVVSFIANPDEVPLSFIEILEQMGLAGEPVPAETLVDKTFTILRAKQFESKYDQPERPYFCVVKPVDSSSPISVVLGGGACVEVITAYALSGNTAPLKVTLRFKENAGVHDGYYYFE